MWLRRLLQDSRPIFALGIISAFVFPDLAVYVEPWLLYVGVVLMTATLLDIEAFEFSWWKWRSILVLLALNFVVLTAAYSGVAFLFDSPVRDGLLVLALMPPSIGVISMTSVLRGDTSVSFYAECVAYLVSLVSIPLVFRYVIGGPGSVWPVLRVLVWLLVVPVVLSRIGRRVLEQRFTSFHGWVKPVFNVCYGVSFFTVVGVNRELLLGEPWLIASVAAALVSVKFVLSTGAHLVLRRRLRRAFDVDAVLFTSFKNGGMAVIFVLAVMGEAASLPLAVNSLIAPFHIVYLERVLIPPLR